MTLGEHRRTAAGVAEATSFARDFARANELGVGGFREWVLHPGMLFRASRTWWGDGGARPAPHEGLDLCYYCDRENRTHRLGGQARVPALYEGVVMGIAPDFLGHSVIVRHDLSGCDDVVLCTIYAHTIPQRGTRVGKRVRQGDVVACLADVSARQSSAGPHLHLSIALAPKGLACEELDWEEIGDPQRMTLIDPLPFVGKASLLPADGWAGLLGEREQGDYWEEVNAARARIRAELGGRELPPPEEILRQLRKERDDQLDRSCTRR